MDAGKAKNAKEGPVVELPADVYIRRLRELNLLQAADQRREKLLGYSKLAVAVVAIVCLLLFLHYLKMLEFLVAPVALFCILAVLHDNLIRKLRLRARAIAFYEQGQARLEDRWAGNGESGERFLDPLHAYARDLDLFGVGSLFELLCTARTRAGEETLAAWLLAAAPVDEVLQRQDAVRELEARVDFREQLFCLSETVRLRVHPEALAAWGELKPIFSARRTRVLTRCLSALWILSLVVWAVWGMGDVAVIVSILNLAWAHRLYPRLQEAAESLEKAADGLEVLAGVLAQLEHGAVPRAKVVGTAGRAEARWH